MSLEEENAALRAEVTRLSKLCAFLREGSSVGFRHGLVRRPAGQPGPTAPAPTRSLLDL